jgi:peptidoglycan/LPS O-acetylase OafA/YrhL
VLGLLLFLPAELVALGRELMAVAAFSSNFLFWNDAGYFDKAAELKPFLHVWSLAIEEQFYLLWPLALVGTAKAGIDARRLTLLIVAISFGVSCWLALRDPPAAFFLLPSRAWELMVGALLALRSRPFSLAEWQRHAMSWAGVLLIILAAVLIDRHSHFPGWNALFPCLGTACLIASGEGAFCNRRLLCNPLVVFVGLISYSLYLWHWPLLAIARTVNLGELTGFATTLVILVAFVLSLLSWRLVEQPFRRKVAAATPTIPLLRYGFALSVLGFAGGAVHAMRGFPDRVPVSVVEAQLAQKDVNPSRPICHLGVEALRPTKVECRANVPKSPSVGTFVVWGDSHADSGAPGLAQRLGREGYASHQVSKTSCPPLLDVIPIIDGRRYNECATFNRAVLEWIKADPAVVGVVLMARWPSYVDQRNYGAKEKDTTGVRFLLTTSNTSTPTAEQSADILQTHLGALASEVLAAGKRVVVMGSLPESWFDVPTCVAKSRMAPLAHLECGQIVPAGRTRGSTADAALRKVVSDHPGVCLLLPRQSLCSAVSCKVETDAGFPAFYDDNHLSTRGSIWLMDRFDWAPCLN